MRVTTSFVAAALLAMAWPAHAAPTDAQAAQLKARADALSKQLDQVAQQPAPQQQDLMSQHWQQMQAYMRSFTDMGCPMCGAMMHGMPMGGTGMQGGMMGGGMMHGQGMQGGMMGQGMMGCPMMGGAGGGWPMPHGMTPNAYHSDMAAQMKAMRDLIAKAQATPDPAERERLLQQAWDGMYRNMQTMRGMGWMWTPPDQAKAALPEANSKGASLVSTYCSQCHAAPPPSLHSAAEWSDVASRMRGHMQDAGSAGQGVKIPSTEEFSEIVDYLGKHGR